MFKLRLIQLCYIFAPLIQTVQNECVNNYSNEFKVRIFEDFLDLQNNKEAFYYGAKSYNGNDIRFNDDNITIVPKDAFLTYDSENARKITLSDKQIQQVEDGAFNQLDCLLVLNLRNNSIFEIRKKIFMGLGFLRELDLSENILEEIPEQAFTYLSRLRILRLAKNRLRVLKNDSFFKLWLLQYLDLSNNYLQSVPEKSLQYFRNLNNLQLGSNRLVDLGLEHWNNGYNLVILNVSNNGLQRFELSVRYSFRQLRQLYLGNNCLTNLFVTSLKSHLSYLKAIDINDNFWSCRELLRIIQYMHASHIIVSPGNTETLPNINRIACNRPIVYKCNCTVSNVTNTGIEDLEKQEMFPNTITTLETVLMGTVLMAFVYLAVQVSLSTRCVSRLLGRHRDYARLEASSTNMIERYYST